MNPWRGPFGDEEAAHLLRRASFAPRPGEIAAARKNGLEATLDGLLGGETPAPLPDADGIEAAIRGADDRATLAAAALHRFTTTSEPLRELLVLFLHGHFVSAISKVQDGRMMSDQFRLFRTLGPASFLDLVVAVARDPAMIRYLDLERSTPARPNENFARELFELFTLGTGHYSETDIREAARAFVGHRLDGGRFVLSESARDRGEKEVLGIRGPLDGSDVARLAARHPAVARRIAAKLLRFFVTDDPADGLVDAAARIFDEEERHLGNTLKRLLSSEDFFDPKHRFALTRGPVQCAVAALRATGARLPWKRVAEAVQRMGEPLFDPPSVKGYPGGRAWLNPAAWLARRAWLFEVAKAAETTFATSTPAELAAHLLGHGLLAEVAGLIARPQDDGPGAKPSALFLVLCHPGFQRC